MRHTVPKTAILLFAVLVCCLILATALLVCKEQRPAPAFVEFSAGDAPDGKTDCYVNELLVWDRYAEGTGKTPDQLLLVSFTDADGQTVLLSLLLSPDDALYARLLPYVADDKMETLPAVSGYFFTGTLSRLGDGAVQAFTADADDCMDWVKTQTDAKITAQQIVLRFAGGTEADYRSAVRARTAWMTVAAIALYGGAVLCGVFAIRKIRKRDAGTLAI